MTTVPKPTSNPNYGLALHQGTWKAHYRDGGKRIYHNLRTADVEVARDRRDNLYAGLIAAGADHPCRKAPLSPDDDKGIYEVKPYAVRLHGVHVGNYATLEEAREAKRNHLKK